MHTRVIIAHQQTVGVQKRNTHFFSQLQQKKPIGKTTWYSHGLLQNQAGEPTSLGKTRHGDPGTAPNSSRERDLKGKRMHAWGILIISTTRMTINLPSPRLGRQLLVGRSCQHHVVPSQFASCL